MNEWMRNPRVEKGEANSFAAEQAEKRGNFAAARVLHQEAANAFASIAIAVPSDYPNTRSDLAIAAIASFARAGDFGQAIEFARRMLAESDALTEYGRTEIVRLDREYTTLLPSSLSRSATDPGRGRRVRDEVRGLFKRAA
jgi:hypothetical protein